MVLMIYSRYIYHSNSIPNNRASSLVHAHLPYSTFYTGESEKPVVRNHECLLWFLEREVLGQTVESQAFRYN